MILVLPWTCGGLITKPINRPFEYCGICSLEHREKTVGPYKYDLFVKVCSAPSENMDIRMDCVHRFFSLFSAIHYNSCKITLMVFTGFSTLLLGIRTCTRTVHQRVPCCCMNLRRSLAEKQAALSRKAVVGGPNGGCIMFSWTLPPRRQLHSSLERLPAGLSGSRHKSKGTKFLMYSERNRQSRLKIGIDCFGVLTSIFYRSESLSWADVQSHLFI